jgi:hypothetical protein
LDPTFERGSRNTYVRGSAYILKYRIHNEPPLNRETAQVIQSYCDAIEALIGRKFETPNELGENNL